MIIGRHRVDKDLVLRFVAEATGKGTALIMAFLLARWLATEGFGAYSQTQALVAILVPVALLGLGFAVIRQIAGAVTAAEISAPVTTAIAISLMITLPVGLVMWLGSDLIAGYFSNHPAARPLVQMAALLLPAAALQSLLYEALRARQRVYSATTLQIGEALLNLAAIIALSLTESLEPVAAFTAVAAIKLLFFLLAAGDFIHSQHIRAGELRFLPKSGIRAALALGIPFMIAGVGESLMGLADRVLVGSIGSADMVGRYVAAQTLLAILASWGAPYWWLLYPRMAQAMATDSKCAVLGITHRLFGHFIIWGLPLAVVLALLGSQIITLTVGDTFFVSTAVVSTLVLAVFINQAATPWEYFLYITGKAVFLMWVSLFWGIAAVAGIVVLLPEFGLLGTAVSVAGARFGFALSIVFAAETDSFRPKLLPTEVTKRALVAVGSGIAVVVTMGVIAAPIPTEPWHSAAAFLMVYVSVNMLAAKLQARRRAV
ncbi:MAG: hypothetical protein CL573_06485 [Alphaproteobacteria bacterium]|nr:hypothetical protein [Alphaproteobacteria bacterium]